MSKEIKPQKPLSIEQAGNLIKEKKETLASDMKKEAKNAPISIADPEERKRYLLYGISLLDDISEANKNAWCSLAGKAPGLYTTRNVAKMLKMFLTLRTHNFSLVQIAYKLQISPDKLEKIELLALQCVMENREKTRNTGIPIFGEN
jgi:hypothetical protein